VATQIAKNCRRQQPHSHLRSPPRGTPASICIHLIFRETRVICLHFRRCVYGSIFIQICAVGSKGRTFSATECVLAVQGRTGSSKVDDFGTNRKRVLYDFLLVGHCNCGPILHRFWDTVTYWPIFVTLLLPLSHLAPLLPMSPLEFCGEVNHEETRVMGLLLWTSRLPAGKRLPGIPETQPLPPRLAVRGAPVRAACGHKRRSHDQ